MFHLIWGRHFTATFRILLICCERSEYGPKNIDVPTELFNNTGSFHLLQTCTEFFHHGFTYPEPHQAIHII